MKKIVIILCICCLVILTGCTSSRPSEDDIYDALSVCYEPIATLYCYFEGENDISFREAKVAFSTVCDKYDQLYDWFVK